MCRIVLAGLVFALAGCGTSEPSNEEVARGMMEMWIRETGVSAKSVSLKAKAKKIGNGRWRVQMVGEKNGERRTLNATAVMDENGDIHYYTD